MGVFLSLSFWQDILIASIRMAAPLLFVSLAALFSERAGMVNIGLDGIMEIGALAGFMVCFLTKSPALGIVGGMCAGILINMIYAYCTITLCGEQIVYGMVLNILAPALAAFIYRIYYGVNSSLPQDVLMGTVDIPILPKESFLHNLLFNQTPMVYIAFALIIGAAVFMNKTKAGLKYKSVGEYPQAAETLGINVIATKYIGCIICGALAGIAGAYLTNCYVNTYTNGIIAGRGFIALTAVIFGRWTSSGIMAACLLFGFFDALQLRLQVVDATTPYQLFQMIPYAATLIALVVFGIQKAGPKANGKPYIREQRS